MEVLLYRAKRLLVGVCVSTAALTLAAQGIAPKELAAAAPAPAAASAHVSPAQTTLDRTHRIQPGDKLSYRVEQDHADAKILTVTDSGEIELPFNFGRYPVSGKTCETLERELKTALEKDYYNHATIHLSIETMNNVIGQVYVSGEVTKPGPVTIPATAPLKLSQTLLSVVPTQWAKLSEVMVVRTVNGKPESRKVDMDSVLNKGHLENDVTLEPGDLVIVRQRGINF